MLAATHAVDIHLVLLLSDPGVATDLGASAWLAAAEAAQLYASADASLIIPVDEAREVSVKATIERWYLGPDGVAGTEPALPYAKVRDLLAELSPATKASGTSWVDQRALVALVLEALEMDEGHTVVITDRPIQPPHDLRYLIWDPVPGGVAVSMATLDPRYWSESVDLHERRRAVKRRLRAALCSVVGTLVGLVRCDNPWCFLYADVERVTRLDDFLFIGEEHRVQSLARRGFGDEVSEGGLEAVVDVAPPPA